MDVTFEDGVLGIFVKAAPIERPGRWLRQERPWGSFVRRLEVPSQVETGKITAHFENGELTITIPKTAKPKPVKIEIGTAKKEFASANKS